MPITNLFGKEATATAHTVHTEQPAAVHKLSRAHLLTLTLSVDSHQTERNHLLSHAPFSTQSIIFHYQEICAV